MKLDKNIKLPEKFLGQYRTNILLRTVASIAVIAVCAVLCTVIDFSKTKYPVMGAAMVILVGFALSCVVFRFHAILFCPTWSGMIVNVDASYKMRTKERRFTQKFIVTLTIDCGEKQPKKIELTDRYTPKENKFYEYAPYKVDDTVVYLRGMKYPMRYNVEEKDMLDIHFVCPYCGEINKAERDKCFRCGRMLVK